MADEIEERDEAEATGDPAIMNARCGFMYPPRRSFGRTIDVYCGYTLYLHQQGRDPKGELFDHVFEPMTAEQVKRAER